MVSGFLVLAVTSQACLLLGLLRTEGAGCRPQVLEGPRVRAHQGHGVWQSPCSSVPSETRFGTKGGWMFVTRWQRTLLQKAWVLWWTGDAAVW